MYLVFDIGDVLFYTEKNAQYIALARMTGHSVVKIIDFFEKQQLPKLNELGLISSRTIHEQFLRSFDAQLTFDDFSVAMNSVIERPNSQLLRFIQRLNDRHPIALASNIGEIHWNNVKRYLKFWLQNYQRCLSFEIGSRKPKREFFLQLIEILDCKAADIIFVDDSKDNVNQANSLNICGYVHTSTNDTIRELADFLK